MIPTLNFFMIFILFFNVVSFSLDKVQVFLMTLTIMRRCTTSISNCTKLPQSRFLPKKLIAIPHWGNRLKPEFLYNHKECL